jgi:hypothetical protein
LAAALNPIPVVGLWMNRKAILLANVMFVGGSILIVGASEVRRFLLTGSRRMGSFLIMTGFFAIWKDRAQRWTILAFIIQLLGILSLFGPYAQNVFRLTSRFLLPALISMPAKFFRAKL